MQANTDGNNSINQHEIYTMLEDTKLSKEQKSYIYQSINSGWKNNPYEGGKLHSYQQKFQYRLLCPCKQ